MIEFKPEELVFDDYYVLSALNMVEVYFHANEKLFQKIITEMFEGNDDLNIIGVEFKFQINNYSDPENIYMDMVEYSPTIYNKETEEYCDNDWNSLINDYLYEKKFALQLIEKIRNDGIKI